MALTLLIEPFQYTFFQRATLATLAVGVAAPLAGAWAMQRRLVYLIDALSHGVLAGVAAAALLGTSLTAGALVTARVMAALVALLVIRVKVAEDSSIGLVGQGLFALGVLGLTLQQDPRALHHVLFGNPLTVSGADVAIDVGLAVAIVLAVLWLRAVLSATTFDPQHARTLGLLVALVDTGVVLGLAVVVVIGLSSVGVLMALTLSLAPPWRRDCSATAHPPCSAPPQRVASPPGWSDSWSATTPHCRPDPSSPCWPPPKSRSPPSPPPGGGRPASPPPDPRRAGQRVRS